MTRSGNATLKIVIQRGNGTFRTIHFEAWPENALLRIIIQSGNDALRTVHFVTLSCFIEDGAFCNPIRERTEDGNLVRECLTEDSTRSGIASLRMIIWPGNASLRMVTWFGNASFRMVAKK